MSAATFTQIPNKKESSLRLDKLQVCGKKWTHTNSVEYHVRYGGLHFFLKVFQSTDEADIAFDRELEVYQHIMADHDMKRIDDCPVVEAYGWVLLPPNICKTRMNRKWVTYQLSGNLGARALIKKLVDDKQPFDLKGVPPSKMITHRLTLNRLKVMVAYDRAKFQSGRLFDLSGAEISVSDSFDDKKQNLQLMRCVLHCFGHPIANKSEEDVLGLWKDFNLEAIKNPSMPEKVRGWMQGDQEADSGGERWG